MIKSKRMRYAGLVARMWEKRNGYRLLVGNSERRRPLGIARHKWVYNIKIDLRVIECAGMDWIHLAEDGDRWKTLVNTVMNLRIP
jgi:hypothetical protein